MECGYARLTVWFADPFWVGVYEREAEGRLEVCRHTFGAELWYIMPVGNHGSIINILYSSYFNR